LAPDAAHIVRDTVRLRVDIYAHYPSWVIQCQQPCQDPA
jgi:hypothetical protein